MTRNALSIEAVSRGLESRGGPGVGDPNAGPWAKNVKYFRQNVNIFTFLGHFKKKPVTFPSKILMTFFSRGS